MHTTLPPYPLLPLLLLLPYGVATRGVTSALVRFSLRMDVDNVAEDMDDDECSNGGRTKATPPVLLGTPVDFPLSFHKALNGDDDLDAFRNDCC